MNSYNTDIILSNYYNLQSVHFEWNEIQMQLDIVLIKLEKEGTVFRCNS